MFMPCEVGASSHSDAWGFVEFASATLRKAIAGAEWVATRAIDAEIPLDISGGCEWIQSCS